MNEINQETFGETDDPKIKPSRLWYLLAGVILLVGIGSAVWTSVSAFCSILGAIEPATKVFVPGKGDVIIDEAGEYVISYEYHYVTEGKLYKSSEEVPGLECRIIFKSTGDEIPVEPLSYSYTYKIGNRAGVGVWKFNAARPGTYELSAKYADGSEKTERIALSIDKGFSWKSLVTLLIGIPLALIGIVAAGVICVITHIKRDNCRKHGIQMNQPQPPAGSQPWSTGSP